MGWDKLNSFVDEYTDALENLELDQVSDPVTSQYGVHIIKVTDVYTAPEDTSTITSIDQIPEAFRSTIEDMAKSVKANSDYTDWLDKKKESADIVVNDMPSGLPYDIDLSGYSKSESSESSSATVADDGTVEVNADSLEEGDVEIDASELEQAGEETGSAESTGSSTEAAGTASESASAEGSSSSSSSAQ